MKLVDLYLSVSNHFGTMHANWFDFGCMVLGWWIIVVAALVAIDRIIYGK